MASALDQKTPACDLEQARNTDIETAIYIVNKIVLGQIDARIATGVDLASDAPLVLGEKMRKILLAAGRAKTFRQKFTGSSIATGHPFAATVGRVLATLARLLYEKASGRGGISVCAAGGMGATVILER